MRIRRGAAFSLAAIMALSMTACGSGGKTETVAEKAPETTAAAKETTGETAAVKTEQAPAVTDVTGDIKEVEFPEQLNNGEPCTIRFAWWGGQTRHERTEQVVKMFMEKYPNVTIETEPTDFNGYFQKLPTLIGASDVWDVFQLGNNWSEFNDIITDLTPYIKDGTINTDNISDAFLSTTYDMGKQMEISLGTNAHCIIYNADMFAEAGIPEPDDNWTWDQYEEYAKKLQEVTGEFGSSSLEEFYAGCTVGVPQFEKGLNFFKSDNSGMMIDKADYMVPFIEMIQRMTAEGSYPDRGALNEMGVSPEQNFVATGEAAMTWKLSNEVAAMAKAAEENGVGNLKLAAIPKRTADGPEGYAVKSSQGLAIYTGTKYPEVCAAFINYFINSVEANQVLLGERGVPISSAVRAAIQPNLTDVEKSVYDYIGKVGSWDTSDVFINEPACQSAIRDEFKSQLDRVINGEESAEEAAQNVLDFANAEFSR